MKCCNTKRPLTPIIEAQIGEGSFGKVHKGSYKGNPCAVKVSESSTAKASIERESKMLQSLSKKNNAHVIKLLGSNGNTLILEFMNLGDLEQYLLNKSLKSPEFKYLARQIATGLEYIHGKKIVHLDLASRNILASKKKGEITLKISDFGASARTGTTHSKIRHPLDLRITCPSLYTNSESALDNRADIWSLGMLCIEMLQPNPNTLFKEVNTTKLIEQRRNKNPNFNPSIHLQKGHDSLLPGIKSMLSFTPEERPSAKEIKSVLPHDKTPPNGVNELFVKESTDKSSTSDVKRRRRESQNPTDNKQAFNIVYGNETIDILLTASERQALSSKTKEDQLDYLKKLHQIDDDDLEELIQEDFRIEAPITYTVPSEKRPSLYTPIGRNSSTLPSTIEEESPTSIPEHLITENTRITRHSSLGKTSSFSSSTSSQGTLVEYIPLIETQNATPTTYTPIQNRRISLV
ncbi:hypothetical protein DID78_05210 [Candidatus Marinamargulisbacteria bacterium SCGC AG-343-D04]|nr:hypothetical protein DID78_05210 [Candidatus Marinamargulisbacteria bacterium SCGC AG-343-D04]